LTRRQMLFPAKHLLPLGIKSHRETRLNAEISTGRCLPHPWNGLQKQERMCPRQHASPNPKHIRTILQAASRRGADAWRDIKEGGRPPTGMERCGRDAQTP
jgi:hypothetical protein